ncbi:MAG: tRNA pseudouridine(38-40) synthase TruA [Actinobacteria bacterium]|nr:tRNA pseudouridine(38-40) synthase TruA [Actinomycetota bacterium]
MYNFSAVVEYDGTDFKGFQQQPGNVRTVQGELFKALGILAPGFSRFSYAGRTDAGVHARHQVIGFGCREALNIYRFSWKLNCLLPDDITVKNISRAAEDFDARKSAKMRQYSYYVVNNSCQSVFLKKYSILITRKLDICAMREAADMFTGVKDFTAFCNDNLKSGHNIREIYSCAVKRFSGELIEFKISANAFLYNMVRIMVGTLLEIGEGKRDAGSIKKAFKSKIRKDAGRIVPAKGLFLTKVTY